MSDTWTCEHCGSEYFAYVSHCADCEKLARDEPSRDSATGGLPKICTKLFGR